MPRYVRTTNARTDLRQIAIYIARDNPSAAMTWLAGVEQLFGLLASQPHIGELIRSDRLGTIRRISHGAYVVYFRPVEQGVQILRVIHGARQHEDLI
ncbi:MAG: type II toxin-antitoxin system RelE/ParE family toxin [Planctomycetaceae bacterium]|nr:type II toxin-antitoxin system RelE/ParE family toxin [Planctomycetaceae bacterium]